MFSSPGIPKTWVTPSFSRHSTISSAVDRKSSLIATSVTAYGFVSAATLLTIAEPAPRDEDGGMSAADLATAKQISELEARRYQAMTEADTAVLGYVMATYVIYTHSDASTDTRAGYLDKLARGELDYGPLEHPETSILTRGDVALVLGDMRGEVVNGGQLRALNSKTLSVWVRAGESWQLIAFQPTRYPA